MYRLVADRCSRGTEACLFPVECSLVCMPHLYAGTSKGLDLNLGMVDNVCNDLAGG